MFELNGIKYDFKRVTVADALEIQKIIFGAIDKNGNEVDMGDALGKITPYAIKYIKVQCPDGSFVENADADTLGEMYFQNPFFALEVAKNFFEVIQGFLASLPSFQNSLKNR